MIWVPPPPFQNFCEIQEKCTTCPSQDVMFLALIATIFGFSKDKKIDRKTPEEVDFIIVGAGAAGCVVANRLSENENTQVLLLEAGGEEMAINEVPGFTEIMYDSNVYWKYSSKPEEYSCRAYNGCSVSRGKVMGGSSAVNAMLYVRGSHLDYDTWEKLGNEGWSYKDVLPYFKKSENNGNDDIVKANPDYHNKGGYLSVERMKVRDLNSEILANAWQELGYEYIDFNAKKQLGVMIAQTTTHDGKRHSANEAFIRPIREKRSNLYIETESLVTRIIIDEKTKKAIGVEYNNSGEKKVVLARKEVIISAGAFDSPKLLMLSGVGPSEELEKHNIKVIKDLSVGRNLQEHVTIEGLHIKLSKTIVYEDCREKN